MATGDSHTPAEDRQAITDRFVKLEFSYPTSSQTANAFPLSSIAACGGVVRSGYDASFKLIRVGEDHPGDDWEPSDALTGDGAVIEARNRIKQITAIAWVLILLATSIYDLYRPSTIIAVSGWRSWRLKRCVSDHARENRAGEGRDAEAQRRIQVRRRVRVRSKLPSKECLAGEQVLTGLTRFCCRAGVGRETCRITTSGAPAVG
jgi:hypothetical protein